MKSVNTVRTLALSLLIAAGAASAPAFAQVSFNIRIAPPAPLVEPMPAMAPGYVWAPGYWAWHGDRHIWVHGRPMMQRVGYRWQPDVWEQRNDNYYRHPGRWERDGDMHPGYKKKGKKVKHANNGQGNDGPGKNHQK